jgi:hypothetical protein
MPRFITAAAQDRHGRLYASHTPDGTSADLIYHLYQLDPPD